ncbi:hypothetical protein M0R04_09800 [Candidatus Dojkabacteria bacterium]|jgi:hypothetical protein|nr:hypothetical protein [Candidatus Dojkabacteria bacterium]
MGSKTTKLGIILLLIGITLIIVTAAVSYFGFSDNATGSTKVKKVTCDITVQNAIGIPFIKNGELYVKTANCQSETKLYCNSIPFLNSIISDSGNVILKAGGNTDSVSVNVFEGDSKTVTLSLCVSDAIDKGIISIVNSNKEVVDSEEVNF